MLYNGMPSVVMNTEQNHWWSASTVNIPFHCPSSTVQWIDGMGNDSIMAQCSVLEWLCKHMRSSCGLTCVTTTSSSKWLLYWSSCNWYSNGSIVLVHFLSTQPRDQSIVSPSRIQMHTHALIGAVRWSGPDYSQPLTLPTRVRSLRHFTGVVSECVAIIVSTGWAHFRVQFE